MGLIPPRTNVALMQHRMAILAPDKEEKPVYVFKVAARMNQAARAALRASWNDEMGPNAPKLLILDNGAELEVVGDGNKPVEVAPAGEAKLSEDELRAVWTEVAVANGVVTIGETRPSAVEPCVVLEDAWWPPMSPGPIFLTPNQWLAMAYAAGLLGLVQAGFWIVRWWG